MKKLLVTFAIIYISVFRVFADTKLDSKNLSVIMSPEVSVSPNPYMFNDTYIGETTSALFTFSNTGTDPLNITDITFTNPVFSIDYTSFTIEPGQSGDLPVKFTPDSQGFFEGTMQIWSNDPVNNPYEVELSGNGVVELIDGWQWIETGFNYILMDIEFPEGQNQVGYAIGETYTYNGDGIVIKTTDSGLTWTQLTPDGIPGLEEMSFIDMQTGYAAGWDGYVIKTTDGGATWDTLTVASNMFEITDIEFYNENNGIILEQSNVYLTQDGGNTWTQGNPLNNSGYMVDYLDANTLVAVGNENYIYKSTDGGNNWEVKNSGNIGQLLLGVDFLNDQYGMAVGDYGYIFKTIDGGDTWTSDQQMGDQLLHVPFIWDEDTAWVCGTPEMVFKTTNGGVNWNSAYNGNYQKAFYRITFTNNYTGFICGGSGGIVLRKEGLAEVPAINVTPEAITFEDTYVGEIATETLTITNTGFSTLEVTDIVSTNDVFTVDVTSFSLDPGTNQEVIVTFTPDDEGLFEGVLQITNNDPENSLIEVEVSGEGLLMAPAISVDTDEIEFSDTYIGEYSSETLTISNTGNAILEVTDITSNNPVFTVDITSFTVEPGNNQEVTVTFTPDDELLYEGILQIESNDPQTGTFEVVLSGNGMIAYPSIAVEPAEIIFDTTLVNEFSTEILTIGNTGIAALDVTNIFSSNTVFTVDITNFDLEPNEYQEVEVTFTPAEQLMYEGILQIESNDPNGTFEVLLSGYGDINTYINERDLHSSIKIYPNPVKDVLYINNIEHKEIFIYDIFGNLKLNFLSLATTREIIVSEFQAGFYIVRVVGKEGVVTKKIEVKK